MRFDNLDDVQALVDDKIPESPSLEYKRELHLDSQPQRREVLKDLTAMGNGGGGTIVYGVDESSGDWPVASAVTPLTERALVSRLENVVRDAVRPPLLWDLAVVAADEDGFVLAIDVLRSPLGPYMVQAYGSMKYHVRVGRRIEEMTEALVRDAYELAGRARDRRAEVWRAHSLPVSPPTADDAWLSVSALPEEPLIELVDVAGDPTDLRPIGALASQAGHGAFSNAVTQWHRWADGFFERRRRRQAALHLGASASRRRGRNRGPNRADLRLRRGGACRQRAAGVHRLAVAAVRPRYAGRDRHPARQHRLVRTERGIDVPQRAHRSAAGGRPAHGRVAD